MTIPYLRMLAEHQFTLYDERCADDVSSVVDDMSSVVDDVVCWASYVVEIGHIARVDVDPYLARHGNRAIYAVCVNLRALKQLNTEKLMLCNVALLDHLLDDVVRHIVHLIVRLCCE